MRTDNKIINCSLPIDGRLGIINENSKVVARAGHMIFSYKTKVNTPLAVYFLVPSGFVSQLLSCRVLSKSHKRKYF